MENKKLVTNGGKPIRTRPWPKWPKVTLEAIDDVVNLLNNGRWSISGPYEGNELWNNIFSKAFAKFNKSRYCVTASNGSSALVAALESLDIGYGDDVVIPGLTWVANVATVLQVNARPILADCDPDTLCINTNTIADVITKNTKAVVAVHLYSALCDLDELRAYTREKGILLIEDCSNVHGAKYKNIGVGNYGLCGTFSMQQTKVLTSGEGGCIVTNDENLFLRMQQSRADGRIINPSKKTVGELQLEELGEFMGTNYCLSELHAVILYHSLRELAAQLKLKTENANYLRKKLSTLPGITLQNLNPHQTGSIYYAFVVKFNTKLWPQPNIMQEILKLELNAPIGRPYNPLNKNVLYNPLSKRSNFLSDDFRKSLQLTKEISLPNAENVFETCITMPHQLFLAEKIDMDDIYNAFEKNI